VSAELTLVEFLRARAQDEEDGARAAADAYHGLTWTSPGDGTVVGDSPHHVTIMYDEGSPLALADHIARHDPARVLADVEAKRAVLDRLEFVRDTSPPVAHVRALDMKTGADAALRDVAHFLAVPYASHPDYRAEWRP
jgi:hypothetical protein